MESLASAAAADVVGCGCGASDREEEQPCLVPSNKCQDFVRRSPRIACRTSAMMSEISMSVHERMADPIAVEMEIDANFFYLKIRSSSMLEEIVDTNKLRKKTDLKSLPKNKYLIIDIDNLVDIRIDRIKAESVASGREKLLRISFYWKKGCNLLRRKNVSLEFQPQKLFLVSQKSINAHHLRQQLFRHRFSVDNSDLIGTLRKLWTRLHFECDLNGIDPVKIRSIMRLDASEASDVLLRSIFRFNAANFIPSNDLSFRKLFATYIELVTRSAVRENLAARSCEEIRNNIAKICYCDETYRDLLDRFSLESCLIGNSIYTMHRLIDVLEPLNRFSIYASHNTYLETLHQLLMGKTNSKMYRIALLAGLRAIEIDLYDDDCDRNGIGQRKMLDKNGDSNGDEFDDEDDDAQTKTSGPKVHHLSDLIMDSLSLKDILIAINDTAFVTSDFPVFVTLESHCSLQGRKQIRDCISKYIARKYQIKSKDVEDWKLDDFNLQNLKHKIIFICRTLKTEKAGRDPMYEYTNVIEKLSRSLVNKLMKGGHEADNKENGSLRIFSLSERNASSVNSKYSRNFAELKSNHLIRVYPMWYEIFSSNFDFLRFVLMGINYVALNVQNSECVHVKRQQAFFRMLSASKGYVSCARVQELFDGGKLQLLDLHIRFSNFSIYMPKWRREAESTSEQWKIPIPCALRALFQRNRSSKEAERSRFTFACKLISPSMILERSFEISQNNSNQEFEVRFEKISNLSSIFLLFEIFDSKSKRKYIERIYPLYAMRFSDPIVGKDRDVGKPKPLDLHELHLSNYSPLNTTIYKRSAGTTKKISGKIAANLRASLYLTRSQSESESVIEKQNIGVRKGEKDLSIDEKLQDTKTLILRQERAFFDKLKKIESYRKYEQDSTQSTLQNSLKGFSKAPNAENKSMGLKVMISPEMEREEMEKAKQDLIEIGQNIDCNRVGRFDIQSTVQYLESYSKLHEINEENSYFYQIIDGLVRTLPKGIAVGDEKFDEINREGFMSLFSEFLVQLSFFDSEDHFFANSNLEDNERHLREMRRKRLEILRKKSQNILRIIGMNT